MSVLTYNRKNPEALVGVTLMDKNHIIRGVVTHIETVSFDQDEVQYAVLDSGEKISTRRLKW